MLKIFVSLIDWEDKVLQGELLVSHCKASWISSLLLLCPLLWSHCGHFSILKIGSLPNQENAKYQTMSSIFIFKYLCFRQII